MWGGYTIDRKRSQECERERREDQDTSRYPHIREKRDRSVQLLDERILLQPWRKGKPYAPNAPEQKGGREEAIPARAKGSGHAD
jgi:hypothetical protein